MKIIRESLLEGARRAQGTAIIIDVFRAFTVTPLFFHFGAKEVILVETPEEAFSFRSDKRDIILSGEVNEQLIPGFDIGNSPSEIINKPHGFFEAKTLVQRTTAGVCGVLSAIDHAETVILGSYVMAEAISKYIRTQVQQPDLVYIVAMGSRGITKSPEDEGCADYLEHLLSGRTYNHIEALNTIILHTTAQKFLNGDRSYLPKEDPVFCLQRDLCNFVLLAQKSDGIVRIKRVGV